MTFKLFCCLFFCAGLIRNSYQNITIANTEQRNYSACSNDIFYNILENKYLENYLNANNKAFCMKFLNGIGEKLDKKDYFKSLNESFKKEEMPSFGEWREKEKERNKNEEIDIQAIHGSQKIKGSKMINFASITCGAKIVHVNPEAQNPSFILFENKDQYMINPCKARKTISIELCEAIQIQNLELGNLELFASLPEKFEVFISERFPSKDWTLLGSFHARDERAIQTFPIDLNIIFAKYLKIDFLSHYGNEHYCPLTVLRVFGITMDEDDDIDVQEIVDEESLINNPHSSDSPNLFSSATSTVISLVNNVLRSKPDEDQKATNHLINGTQNETNLTENIFRNNTVSVNFSIAKNGFEPQLPFPIIIDRIITGRSEMSLKFFSLWKYRCNINDSKYQCYITCRYIQLLDQNFIFNSSSIYIMNNSIYISENKRDIFIDLQIKKDVDFNTLQMDKQNINKNNSDIVQNNGKLVNITNGNNSNDVKLSEELNKVAIEDFIVETQNVETVNDTEVEQPFILVEKREIHSSISSKLDLFHEETNLEDITYQKLTSRGKETIFLKLKNRIKSLEHNLNLTTRYLDELTQNLKRQIDEMNHKINESVYNYIASALQAKEKASLQQDEIKVLQNNVSMLTETLSLLNNSQSNIKKSIRFQHMIMMGIEVIILVVCMCIFKFKYINPLYNQVKQDIKFSSDIRFLNNSFHPVTDVENSENLSEEELDIELLDDNKYPSKYKKKKKNYHVNSYKKFRHKLSI